MTEFALQANLAVIERFGKFQRIGQPGEHAQMPLGGAAAAAVQLHRVRQSLIGRHHACCCKQQASKHANAIMLPNAQASTASAAAWER